MSRKRIIGLMGGNDAVGAVAREARMLGATVVRAQEILLTGGRCLESTEVKNAAMQGADDEEQLRTGSLARLIGILPNGPREWSDIRPHTLFLTTNLSGKERDAINGVTPDVLIFFAGSSGTLCELTFALQATKPVLFWNATQMLREKYLEHTTKDHDVEDYLRTALDACKTRLISVAGITDETTVRTLKQTLDYGLEQALDFPGSIEELIHTAVQMVGIPEFDSGFPGFSDEPSSKPRFEEFVRRISASLEGGAKECRP